MLKVNLTTEIMLEAALASTVAFGFNGFFET